MGKGEMERKKKRGENEKGTKGEERRKEGERERGKNALEGLAILVSFAVKEERRKCIFQ